MLTTIDADPYTVRGVSVGGVYTSLQVPELSVMLDVGASPRSFAGVDRLFLSHGHVDHVGGLPAFLGIRALTGKRRPLPVYLPAEIAAPLESALAHLSTLQRYELAIEAVAMEPGQVERLRGDLHVRAFRTYHPVPSLGYQFFRRIQKLKPEFANLSGRDIGRRRQEGTAAELFDEVDRLELAYATDTLVQVLEHEPSLFDSRVLILECTFLDDRKSLAAARSGCHIHLDELLPLADRFNNEHLVLMHFSQIYKPSEVPEILRARCPEALHARIRPLAPDDTAWPG